MSQKKPLLTILVYNFWVSSCVCVSIYVHSVKKWDYTVHDDLELLKGKLKQLKCTRFYLSKHLFNLDSTKTKVVRSSCASGSWGKAFYRRHGSKAKELFDWLKLKLLPYLGKSGWLFVIGGLKFCFLRFQCIDSALDFVFVYVGCQGIRATQSNGLHV